MTKDGRGRRRWWPHRATALTVALGLALGVLAAATSRRVADDNERRALVQEAAIESSSVSSLVVTVKGAADSAVATAEATDGNAAAFKNVVPGYFAAWVLQRRTKTGWATQLALGTSKGDVSSPTFSASLDRTAKRAFAVVGFLGTGASRVLGVVEPSTNFRVYGEVPLPETAALDPKTGAQVAASLPNLDFALYTDRSERPEAVVLTNTRHLPLTGRRAVVDIDLATEGGATTASLGTEVGEATLKPGHLLLVTSVHGHLAGNLASEFPWFLLGAAAIATFAVGTTVEMVLRRRDDDLVTISRLEAQNVALDQAMAEQARTESERAGLEIQLRAAHRLEAVGKLAGGVAHDFNNLLAVILNYATFAVDELDGHPAREDVEEVVGAARRAAELTHQLLVFSRQDVVEPRVLDVNTVVQGMDKLLQRTLGENLDLRTDLLAGLQSVSADEGELEQVLMNLAVNARDAMRDTGGALTISTANVTLDDAAARLHPDLAPGSYVELSVRDTGAGMPSDVAARVFEPFYTTKPPGEGTGLGLSTVYGIVTRWGGEVTVTSKPGAGTTFTVLLPAMSEEIGGAQPPRHDRLVPDTPAGGVAPSAAVILIVEDEAPVRRAARRILEGAGYRILEADNGAAALSRDDLDTIDVLLTDVVMPGGVSGRDLATEMLARRPNLRVLFMSGYTSDVLTQRDLVAAGFTLVDKPFTATSLLNAVADTRRAPTAARR